VTLLELKERLSKPGGMQRLSPSVDSLLQDFLPGGFNAHKLDFGRFNDGDTTRDAVEAHGAVRDSFVGVPDLEVQAYFFLASPDGSPEVVMRFSEMPGLPQSFRVLPDAAAFSKCVFLLDSRRPDPLDEDFKRLFSTAGSVKRGLGLEATLDISKIDEMAAEFVGSNAILHVKGPVELQEGQPRMRLTSREPLPGPEILRPVRELLNAVEFNLLYQYLSANEKGRQRTKERYKLSFGKGDLRVPLAITLEPNMLSESIVIESDWETNSSPLSLKNLTSFLPDQDLFKGLLPDGPKNAPQNTERVLSKLPDIKLTYLLVELRAVDQSWSISARLESDLSWTIIPGTNNRDLVRLEKLGVDLDVSYYGDQVDEISPWEVSPYITGTMMLAGGRLSGVVDVSAKRFCFTLDDGRENKVNLKTLFKDVLELPEDTFPSGEFHLTRFEILGDITGSAYSIDIGTDFSFEKQQVQLGNKPVKIEVEDLSLKLEYYDGHFTPALGASLKIFEMTFGCLISYQESQGWTFNLTIFNFSLKHILTLVLGEITNADQLPDVRFEALELTITPKTGAFTFYGKATGEWSKPFGSEAQFRCNVELTLARKANAAATAEGRGGVAIGPVNCDLKFKGKGSVTINGKELAATIDVGAVTNGDNRLKLSAKGSLIVQRHPEQPLEIELTFDTHKDKKRISASWSGSLAFGQLADALGANIDSVVPKELIPILKKLSFTYEFDKSQLDLKASTEQFAIEFITAPAPAPRASSKEPARLIVFGLQARKLSTKDPGVLGSALKPYSIAVDKLNIIAANGNAEDLTLLGSQGEISNGVLLTGDLKVEDASSSQSLFDYPFECRLGGDPRTNTKRLPAPGTAASGKLTGDAPKEASKAELTKEDPNNVALGRTVGPLTFRKARFESRDKDGKKYVYVLLDASLGAGGFALDMQGFNLNFPLEALTNPNKLARGLEVGLEGLSIAYSQPPLAISGGFAVTDGKFPYLGKVYRGYLLIKAEAFQITVLGQYGEIMVPQPESIPPRPTGPPTTIKVPSLFLYGMYDGVLGGPAAFYVTGLALGGGYNTKLRLPSIEKVAEFPLISAATTGKTLTTQELANIVEASYGDYWLAVGVKFNSFKMAESFALFTVAFGNRLQFALLGLTTLNLPAEPPGAAGKVPAVHAELAIRAVLDPEGGVFSFEGVLTENSYILDKKIRLVGGFAFFVWFGSSEHAGDFVITLGGYHPTAPVPAHYPVVPRVGIAAKLSEELTITGEAYLAITPSCLMTGLKMNAVFQSGNLSATFVAYADFLIAWAPFHYDAHIGVGLAIVYQSFRTFKLEINANLHVWGPPFAGTATVNFWILPFTVVFGAGQPKEPDPLKWEDFAKAFLPLSDDKAKPATIRITEGLVRELVDNKGKVENRIINPHELMIETDSAVPCTAVSLGPPKNGQAKMAFGIRPIQATNLSSAHVVNITSTARKDNDGKPLSINDKFHVIQYSRKKYPEALWTKNTSSNGGVPSGIVLRIKATEPDDKLGPFPIETFAYEPLRPKKIPWSSSATEPCISQKLGDQPTSVRGKILNCLPQRAPGSGEWHQIKVSETFPDRVFGKDAPLRASLGSSVKIEAAAP
jgi:hypothetical protein